MKRNTKVLSVLLSLLIFAFTVESTKAVEPVPDVVEDAILKTVIEFSPSGDVVLRVQKLTTKNYGKIGDAER